LLPCVWGEFEKFEALLEDIRNRLERLEEKMGPGPTATALKYEPAAKRLGIGLTTLKAMVARRQIRTAIVGGRPKIPVSEIERLLLPEPERPKAERQARERAWTPIAKKRR
jgi:excisionase family DNA binding protein